jgi:hypothetical protein
VSSTVSHVVSSDEGFSVVILGVDPHECTHTASAIEPATNKVLATVRVDASLAGYPSDAQVGLRFRRAAWAVENARGPGRNLAQWLVARGESIDDVPSTATARIRELSRGGRRKNDVIDPSAAASVAALHANPVVAEDHCPAASRQESKVFPGGRPAALRRIRRVPSRPRISLVIRTRRTSAGSQRCTRAVASTWGAAERR